MMLKSGTNRPMEIVALGVEQHPPRFTVAQAFADNLRIGDLVRFKPVESECLVSLHLWSQVWRVSSVEGKGKRTDVRKVYVTEAKDW